MSTLTLSTLGDLRSGDTITAINGDVIDPHTVDTVEPGRARLRHDSPVQWWLYPEHAAAGLTVQRAEVRHRTATRAIGGVRFRSTGLGGQWRSEDGRIEVTSERGISYCELPHPMRITAEHHELAPTGTRVIPPEAYEALRTGRPGYLCPGGFEHFTETIWIAYVDNAQVSEWFETFAEAAGYAVDMVRR